MDVDEHRLRKVRLKWFGHEHSLEHRDENSILRRAMELKVEGRKPIGRLKKTWSKVVEEGVRKLNTEDRTQWRQLMTPPTPGVGN